MEQQTPLLGRAFMEPDAPVIAGTVSTWKFRYQAGPYGIEDSGAIRLAWRMVSDWEVPQFTDPRGYAYTTITTTARNVQFQASYERFVRPYTNSILIRLLRGSLNEGDEITITWGDTSQGGPGCRAQSHQEHDHEFRMLVDPTGSGVFRLVGEPLRVDVVAGWPHRLQAVVPGTVTPGEPFAVTVRCLDEVGNPAPRFRDTVSLRIPELPGGACTLPQEADFSQSGTGVLRLEGCMVDREGPFHVEAVSGDGSMRAVSNPCLCQKAGGQKLFWGDLHGQNADTLGSGTLDEYYTFARDVAAIDVAGWQGNDFEITEETWKKVRRKTAEYLEEGRFLTFLGYEWSGCTPRGGDYNIFFRDDSEAFYPSSDWLSAPHVDPKWVTTPISSLWERLAGRDDVIAIPHVGGRCGNLAYVDTRFTPAVEVHSHHGTFDWFALEAMRRRLKVGFVASSDDHTCRLGLFFPSCGKTPSGGFDVASGYYGIWAGELTKEAVWKALRARHCYASTFDRIYLHTGVEEAVMGDEIALSGPSMLKIRAVGAVPLERVYIYKWDQLAAEIPLRPAAPNRVMIRWKGVVPGGKHKSTRWSGELYLDGGRILEAQEYGIDREDQGIRTRSTSSVSWVSTTSGDYDGVILTLEAGPDAQIRFISPQGNHTIPVAEITEKPAEVKFDPNCSVEFSLAAAPAESEEEWLKRCSAGLEFPIEPGEEETAWWVKVLQENGNAAWATPIFVRKA